MQPSADSKGPTVLRDELAKRLFTASAPYGFLDVFTPFVWRALQRHATASLLAREGWLDAGLSSVLHLLADVCWDKGDKEMSTKLRDLARGLDAVGKGAPLR